MSAAEFIGLAGGTLISLSLIPQLYKTYKSKNAENISYYWQATYIIGLSMNNYYSLSNNLWPIYSTGLFEQFCIILLTIFKFYFSRKKKDRPPSPRKNIVYT